MVMNEFFINQLKRQLKTLKLGTQISDENAYHLYQISNTLFDWLLEECSSKLTRYLLHMHGIKPIDGYDPKDNHPSFDNEDPF